MKNKLYKRKFLNSKKGTALIEIDFDDNYLGSICVSDCNRQVNLDFEIYANDKTKRKHRYNERLKKAKLLANTFQEAVDFMETNKAKILDTGIDYDD